MCHHQDPCIFPLDINDNVENAPSHLLRESQKISGVVPLSGSILKHNGVYSGPKPLLHPSFCGNPHRTSCLKKQKNKNRHRLKHNLLRGGIS